MPRKKRQTGTGEDAQDIKSVPGQRYGEGVEQQAMQRAMPAPDVTGNVPTPDVSTTPTQPGGGPVQSAGPEGMLEYLQGSNPNLLAQSTRPNEPVTAGLSTGPGPGREALMTGNGSTPIGRYLAQLSKETGNPAWARMRERAGL